MLETIFIALIIAKIKKYKLKLFFKNWTVYPLFVLSVVYIIMELQVFKGIYSSIKYTNIFKLLFFLSLFIIIIEYKLYVSTAIGSVFILLGSLLNHIAIKANNGKMPVFATLSKFTGYIKPESFSKINDIHVLGNSAVKYKFLTDIFDVGYNIMSIGDILIRCFVFLVIYKAIENANYMKTAK